MMMIMMMSTIVKRIQGNEDDGDDDNNVKLPLSKYGNGNESVAWIYAWEKPMAKCQHTDPASGISGLYISV